MLDHPIARFENLKVEFQTQDGPVEAVKGVSFDIAAGETVAIVGESGSGKSVSSLSLMRLVEYGGGEISDGRLLFDRGAAGQIDLRRINPKDMRAIRGREIGMIFPRTHDLPQPGLYDWEAAYGRSEAAYGPEQGCCPQQRN